MKLYKINRKTGFYKILIKVDYSKWVCVQVLKEDGSKCGSESNFVEAVPQHIFEADILIEDEIKELETKLNYLKNLNQKVLKFENKF